MDRADVQVYKAFQKQPTVSVKKIQALGNKARYYRDVGLGFTIPKEAKEGTYIDKKCPFTGNVSIRGRIIKGMVMTTKMKRTIIMRVNYLHYKPKYNRFEKRHRNIPCHCAPCFEVTPGDIVTVGQCRPLSKTVRFNVLKAEKNDIFGNPRKQFRLF